MIELSPELQTQPSLSLRRYMSIGKFLDFLEHKRLFFSRLSMLEDKLEGQLTAVDVFLLSGNGERLGNIVNNCLPVLGSDPSQRASAKERQERFAAEISYRTIPTVFGEMPCSSEQDVAKLKGAQKNWLDVNCWDKSTHESMAMWKLYGGSECVCIHSTISALADHLETPAGCTIHVGDVAYTLDRDNVYKGGNALGYFMRKHKAYRYENEVRLVLYNASSNPLTERRESGKYVPVNVDGLLDEVTVSPEASGWFLELISDIVTSRYGLRAKVSRSDLDELVNA